MVNKYNIVAETNEATVVTEYKPVKTKSEAYQSEAELEKEFIHLLTQESYEYLPIHTEDELVKNLRLQLEKLNNYKFSDKEWSKLFTQVLANSNDGIEQKTRLIQEERVVNLELDNGTHKNITIIDKNNIHNNILQVINQYEVSDGNYKNRYDVTILVNGLPLVHVELKRRGVAIKEAFNQINRYQRDSFWAGSGLFEFVQIFVISNGTITKYYSNSTRFNHCKDFSTNGKKEKTSNSFEFTSYWADANNKIIPDLIDFTKTFFSKHTLLNILTKYCIYTEENILLVMRPYQIVATERILNKIEIATNYKKYGTIEGGGYIWHTTGSGKTLTSFKTSKLASELPFIDKVLFVVDRQDLDYQTMREYDKFEEGAANSSKSTLVLEKHLSDPSKKIIITTIQKLSNFISKYKNHDIYSKHIVFIFDECHRSQFGEMHTAITKSFKKYHLFGFTGTPIFAINSQNSNKFNLKTTEQAFGMQLHSYTIVDAINDKNVLPFRVDYIKTIDSKDGIVDKGVLGINTEKAYLDPRRIEQVTKYILDNFNRKTYHNEYRFSHRVVKNVQEVASSKDRLNVTEIKDNKAINGFNSIFAVSSIDAAKAYYNEFKKQLKERSNNRDLKIALIYSFGVNEEESDGILEEEDSDSTTSLDQSSRDFLEGAIKDYNSDFGTTFDTSSDKFPNYYKDVSLRMKNREIDILIVVNMFLTGFDATTLNTLWVDKNLKMHGLIQAYSRTNRILNSVKTFGNIVCFRNLQQATDDAISLFGDKEARGIVLLKSFKEYYEGYKDEKGEYQKGYVDLVNELESKYSTDIGDFKGETDKKEFVKLFSTILRMRNLLSSFDDFKGKELINEYDFGDYRSIYLDLRDEFINLAKGDNESINDDIVFEIELLKQVDINIDYILMLVQKYHDEHIENKEILVKVQKVISGSPELRSKKELIENFITGLNEVEDVTSEWREYINEEKEKELSELITSENLKDEEARRFIKDCFEEGKVKTSGTDIEKILPPMSRFNKSKGNRREKKQNVIAKIKAFFERFFGI